MYPMRTKLMVLFIILLSITIIGLEYFKHLLLPDLTLMQSHLITLCLLIVILSVITSTVHSFVRKLNSQIIKKQGEKSKLETALCNSEERYRAVFENSADPVILLDADTLENVDFNAKSCDLLAYAHHEFEGMKIVDYEAEPMADARKRFERILKSGNMEAFESRFRKKTGEFLDVALTIKLLTIENRKYFLLTWQDIRERKKLQARSIEQFDFLNTLIETIPAPVFYKDRQGKYTGCNKSFEEFLGVSKNEIIGKSVHDIAPMDIAEEYFRRDEELFRNPGQPQVYEWKVKTRKLGLRQVVFSKATFNDYKGNVSGLIGVILDITDLKSAETELKKSRDALAEHNRILVEWTSPDILYRPDLEYIIRKITETVSRIMGVERVGIWLYNTDSTRLYCMDLFDLAGHSHDSELVVADHPSYFAALRKERVIVCRNALSDPRYKELQEAYVKPFHVGALLDVPVIVSGEIIGVICIEHRDEPRDWTMEEQNFAISLANLFSLALEISRHKQLERSLQASRDNFINIVEKLPCSVLIVDMRNKVKFVNSGSEKFFGGKIMDMLGSEFPYPVIAGKTTEAELARADGKPARVSIIAVQTRWDNEPACLVTIQEKSHNGE
ncbi:MAG TPA: hypothetical protein DCZ94_07080 [Lentisphaeria bacterium]|nr:MAG: hypothetical protein A2X48_10305 [Lentisphaerae bacterium GWF2_49_21]HBC86698.1 hypothetical protein [Lentisphaeria bacterium]